MKNLSTPEEIEQAVTKFTTSEGKLDLPKDLSDSDKFVVRHAKRTRDAQAELSKTQALLREAEAATEILSEKALQLTPSDFGLSAENVTALETLKFRDPDAYRLKMNELETQAKANKAKALNEVVTEAKTNASNSFKQKSTIAQLVDFRKANPNVDLSDNVLSNDIPPRLINGYQAGNYEYSTYLAKVAEYLGSGVTMVNPDGAVDEPNLSNQAGSRTPGKAASEKAGKKTYKEMTL